MSYSAPQAHLKWQVPPGAAVPELSCEEALRAAYPGVAATFDALDDVGESHSGDEFVDPLVFNAREELERKDRLFGVSKQADACQLADARCARCSEGDDFALLISGMDDAMIAYADRVLGDDPVWSRLKAIRQAMSESL